MRAVTAVATSRAAALVTLLLAVVAALAVLAVPAPTPAVPPSATGLSTAYSSTVAEKRQATLPASDVEPAIVVVSRPDGAPLTSAQRSALPATAQRLAPLAVGQQVATPRVSDDGTVALLTIPTTTRGGDDAVTKAITELRAAVATALPDGLRGEVTGPPAFTADLSAVFDGADVTLLLATVLVVAVLLVITYRSPVLWIVPLLVVAATEQLTVRVTDLVLPALGLPPDPAAAGITSVLVFGAATDYALLLIARYREELRRTARVTAAMRAALTRTFEPIVASGCTVTLAVLCLTLSATAGNRTLGVSAAIGVVLAMGSALLVLPAVLVLAGRRLFWPLVPRVGGAANEGRIWGRLGQAVARRPRAVAVTSVLLLAILALGALGVQTGLSQNEQFRVTPEAVSAGQTLAGAFPAGATQPVAVLTDAGAAEQVAQVSGAVKGVASAEVGRRSPSVAQVDVVLTAEPGTAASDTALRELRTAVAAVPAANASVGGDAAAALDLKDASNRDARLILPLILGLVAAVLVGLLRCVVAPALLVLTVIGSFFAALGASWLLFEHVLDFPPLDSGVLLLSFLFLVALGVDYNIFLVTRAREDAQLLGNKEGMLNALTVTGGVITSAGVLLAAVFAVLGVLPLVTLTQIGVIVCVGVLLDTFLVRTVLVPALAFALDWRFWWPAAWAHPSPSSSSASDPDQRQRCDAKPRSG